jgi:pimeloyl-ACP methyl ester carboxylesterase
VQQFIASSDWTTSYDTYGSGRPIVLVHGDFSDHVMNWQEAKSVIQERYSALAVARRGRGDVSATLGHSVMKEAPDIAAVLRHVGKLAFLLGHA